MLAQLGKLSACPHHLDHAARPRAEYQDAIGEEYRLVHVVGDEQDRLRLTGEDVGDVALQLLARDGIERNERLVHQQHRRIERERAGNADALLHSTGYLVRIMVLEAAETDQTDHLDRKSTRL